MTCKFCGEAIRPELAGFIHITSDRYGCWYLHKHMPHSFNAEPANEPTTVLLPVKKLPDPELCRYCSQEIKYKNSSWRHLNSYHKCDPNIVGFGIPYWASPVTKLKPLSDSFKEPKPGVLIEPPDPVVSEAPKIATVKEYSGRKFRE